MVESQFDRVLKQRLLALVLYQPAMHPTDLYRRQTTPEPLFAPLIITPPILHKNKVGTAAFLQNT